MRTLPQSEKRTTQQEKEQKNQGVKEMQYQQHYCSYRPINSNYDFPFSCINFLCANTMQIHYYLSQWNLFSFFYYNIYVMNAEEQPKPIV